MDAKRSMIINWYQSASSFPLRRSSNDKELWKSRQDLVDQENIKLDYTGQKAKEKPHKDLQEVWTGPSVHWCLNKSAGKWNQTLGSITILMQHNI